MEEITSATKKKTETKRERKLKEKKTDKRWKLKNSRMW